MSTPRQPTAEENRLLTELVTGPSYPDFFHIGAVPYTKEKVWDLYLQQLAENEAGTCEEWEVMKKEGWTEWTFQDFIDGSWS